LSKVGGIISKILLKTAFIIFSTIALLLRRVQTEKMMKINPVKRLLNYLQSLITALLLSALAQLPSYASSVVSPPCGNISLAYYEFGALFYRTPDGTYAGIDKDVVDELERRSTCHFKTSIESRVRIWSQLSNNTLDMSVSGIATPEREQFARFIPYFTTRNYVLMHKDMPAAAQSMQGFLANPALLVAVVKSFKHGPVYDAWLDKLRAQKRLHEAADFATVMHLFSINRVHAVLALPTSLHPMLQHTRLVDSTLTLDWSPSDRIMHNLILSKARLSQTQFEILEKTMHSMREDGSLERIFRRHLGDKLAKEISYIDHHP
jgi:polar amino acid transport system substrate-binding protein